MAITHNLTFIWNKGSETVTQKVAIESEGEKNIDVTVNAGATDKQVDIAWTNSRLKSVFILSDQAVTLETNNSGAPDTTIALLADTPLVWYSDGYAANPFVAANVTTLYFTNAGSTSANIKIRVLIDATP